MQITTKLDVLTGSDRERNRLRNPASERLAALGMRARGLASAAADVLSNWIAEVLGELWSRMAAARRAAGRGKRMRVVESLALGGRRQLLLVRCDEQEYLVGTGPDSVETIVLRQPGAATEVPSGGDQAGPAQIAQKTRSAGAGQARSGMVFRQRSAHGPWLVTAPEMGAIAKNRVREADSGPGLGLWK